MSYLPPELLPYVKYLTPPVIGAFIGYLTNRIAIRMLFRPLKAWKIGGLRVPMTPGVIPSKRLELAINMGEVVGDHLLTSQEIGRGLQQKGFQDHLYNLIHERVEGVLQKDLGTLASTIPKKFKFYFDIGTKTIRYQLKEQIHTFIHSQEFAETVDGAIDNRLDMFLEQDVGTIITGANREKSYRFLEKNISRMFESEAMEQWVEDFVHQKVYSTLQQQKSLSDILPASLQELFMAMIEKQVPAFLGKIALIVSEPDVRDKIVKGACGGVENFINSLGSMADMVRGFLPMETVEEKVQEYLIEKNDAIVAWLQSEEVQIRVAIILRERSQEFSEKPIVSFIKAENEDVIEEFCSQCTKQLLLLIRGEEVSTTLISMFKTNIEDHIDSGATSMRQVLSSLLGEQSMFAGKDWVKKEIRELLQAQKTLKTIDFLVDSLVESLLLQKKIGKLANLVPVRVREGWSRSLQKVASTMLKNEVPGLVHSLNIRQIVTEKVNSLDILKLEGLLLSIMEEQFKYINLFGALLGFLIGCLNIVFLYGI
jgi:uncharacterized membrane protein YheB (UPF0754 family)